MSLPTVTVVTPSFNQARFLRETLASVTAQRDEIHEYFVLDGGSSDGSVEIIREYGRSIDEWTTGPDGGQSAAIASGFRRATGDVLYWINSDDVLLPGAIRRVREAFGKSGAAPVVTGWDFLIDAESRVLKVRHIPRQTARAALWGVTHISQPACFFTRDLYERVGGLRADLGGVMDTDLWLRMLRVTPTWDHIPAFLAAFRSHPAQKGSAWLEGYAREHRWLQEHYPEFRAPTPGHRLGLLTYRVGETLRGRYLRDYRDSRRFRGQALETVFDSLGGTI